MPAVTGELVAERARTLLACGGVAGRELLGLSGAPRNPQAQPWRREWVQGDSEGG